jgi:pimeloyl-ACP methyl ester carboxylesterase
MSADSPSVLGEAEKRDDGFFHRRVDVGEVRLHIAEARPRRKDGAVAGAAEEVSADASLIVFMHGYPEFWGSWQEQLKAFADAGYWAVAPDMRGYAESDKPKAVSAYRVEKLAGDIAGLVRALGRKTAIIVGHDWGGMAAWFVAQLYPSIVSRLAILNVPHPEQMTRGLMRPQQLVKSWYMFFFQLPFGIPESAVRANDFAALRTGFAKDGFTNEEIEPYVTALRTPGALTGAMSWYRAAVRRTVMFQGPTLGRIDCPVLVIWGDRDHYLGQEMAEPPKQWVPNARVVHIPEASHWVQHDEPARVNELLLAFAREAS